MKSKILLLCNISLVCLSMSLSAQTDFLQFLNSIDWHSDEGDFIKKYSSQIIPCSHFYSSYSKTKCDYKVVGIILGDKECTATIDVDSASLKLKSLSFSFGKIKESKNALNEAIEFTNEMDSRLISIYGKPDQHKDDIDNKFIKNLNRTWYEDNYRIDVVNTIYDSIIYLYSLTVKGIEYKSADFRVAKWGDSKKIVIQKEGKPDKFGNDNLYSFSDYVAFKNCDVIYSFIDDKLTSSGYMFKQNYSNKNEYIKDFIELVDLMTEKYGKPDYNAAKWKNNLYEANPDNYGLALSLGHLSYIASWWSLDVTEISIILFADDDKITLAIQYGSKKYKSLRDEDNNKSRMKNL